MKIIDFVGAEMMQFIGDILAWLVFFIAVPLVWLVWWLLRRMRKDDPDNEVLKWQILVFMYVALTVTVFSWIFLNNDMEIPPLDTKTTRVITRAIVFAAAILAVRWLWINYGWMAVQWWQARKKSKGGRRL